MNVKALALVVLGVVMLVFAVIFGFKSADSPALTDGDVLEYAVTYVENGSVVDTSTYTMTVVGEETVAGMDCYHIDLAVIPPAERVTTIGGNSTVLSGEMWVIKDTLDLARKRPMALNENPTYGLIQVTTTVSYTYPDDHGWPWEVGKSWPYQVSMDVDPDPGYAIPTMNKTAVVSGIENVTVPAGTFECYRIEYTTQGAAEPGLVEWWSEDVGMFIKLVDSANYLGTETRALQYYPDTQ